MVLRSLCLLLQKQLNGSHISTAPHIALTLVVCGRPLWILFQGLAAGKYFSRRAHCNGEEQPRYIIVNYAAEMFCCKLGLCRCRVSMCCRREKPACVYFGLGLCKHCLNKVLQLTAINPRDLVPSSRSSKGS